MGDGEEWPAVFAPPSGTGPEPGERRSRSAAGAGRGRARAAVAFRFGRALEVIRGVRYAQPGSGIGAGHRALALLDHVGEFVGEGVLVRAALAEHDVVAGGVGAGADLGGGASGGGAVVDAYGLEAFAEA